MNAREYRLMQRSALEPQEYYRFLKVYRRKALGNLKRLWFYAIIVLAVEMLARLSHMPMVVVNCISMGTLAFASCAIYIWFEQGWFESFLPGRSWMDNSLRQAMFIWIIGCSVITLSQFGAEQINMLTGSQNWASIQETAQMLYIQLIQFMASAGKGLLLYFLVQNLQQRSFLE